MMIIVIVIFRHHSLLIPNETKFCCICCILIVKKMTRFVASALKIHEKTSRTDDSEQGDAKVQDVDEDGDGDQTA